MASAVFEGTSLVNMFVRGCWVNGIRRLIVSRRGDEEEFFEIRTEWSDRSVLYLHRSFADLGRLCKRLRDAFPEDRPELARAPLRQGAGLQDWGLRDTGLRGAGGCGLWEWRWGRNRAKRSCQSAMKSEREELFKLRLFLPSTGQHQTSRPPVSRRRVPSCGSERTGSRHGARDTHSWRINEMGGKGDEGTRTLTRLSQRISLKKAEFCEATPGTDSYWVPAAFPVMENQWRLEWVC